MLSWFFCVVIQNLATSHLTIVSVFYLKANKTAKLIEVQLKNKLIKYLNKF